MTLTPEMIDAMVAAGVTREQLADVVKRMLSTHPLVERPTPYIRPHVRQAVIARDGFVCVYCGSDVAIPHLDHVVPWSRGGPSSADNLVVSCRSCNASKKDRTPEEWRRP